MLLTNLRRSMTLNYPVNEEKSKHRTPIVGIERSNERLLLAAMERFA